MALTTEQRQRIIDCLDEAFVNDTPELDGCTFADLFGEPTECPAVVGYVNVNADGTIDSVCGDGITAARTGTGIYALTPPAGAESIQLTVLETASRDSIEIHPTDFVGTGVQIHEGDNGTAANNLRDRAFAATWYGKKTFLTPPE